MSSSPGWCCRFETWGSGTSSAALLQSQWSPYSTSCFPCAQILSCSALFTAWQVRIQDQFGVQTSQNRSSCHFIWGLPPGSAGPNEKRLLFNIKHTHRKPKICQELPLLQHVSVKKPGFDLRENRVNVVPWSTAKWIIRDQQENQPINQSLPLQGKKADQNWKCTT